MSGIFKYQSCNLTLRITFTVIFPHHSSSFIMSSTDIALAQIQTLYTKGAMTQAYLDDIQNRDDGDDYLDESILQSKSLKEKVESYGHKLPDLDGDNASPTGDGFYFKPIEEKSHLYRSLPRDREEADNVEASPKRPRAPLPSIPPIVDEPDVDDKEIK